MSTYNPMKTAAKAGEAVLTGTTGGMVAVAALAVLRSFDVEVPEDAQTGVVWLAAVAVPAGVRALRNWAKHRNGWRGGHGLPGMVLALIAAGLMMSCATTTTYPDGTVVTEPASPAVVQAYLDMALAGIDAVTMRIIEAQARGDAEDAAKWEREREQREAEAQRLALLLERLRGHPTDTAAQ